MDLKEYYEEVTKTAGLVPAAVEAETKTETEVEVDDEKVAACMAVAEQFDIDGITFADEDEKVAAAVAIVEGFEQVTEKVAEDAENMNVRKGASEATEKNLAKRSLAEKIKSKVRMGADALKKNKGKAGAVAAGVAAAGGAGYLMGHKKNHKR